MAHVCISFSHLGIHLISESVHFHESCHSFESLKECIVHCCIVFCLVKSMLPSLLLCHPMFKGKSCWDSTPAVKQFFESVLWLHHTQNSRTLFQVSCCRCGIHHGPPSTRLFLSTSAHHPRISLRNKFSTLRYVCLNEKFSHSRHRFHIIDLWSKYLTECLTSYHLFTLRRLYYGTLGIIDINGDLPHTC